ncbi:TPA: hypothetical protein L1I71_003915 [Escherichia albertii]|nr:hypothetical protein [Escherichia coli]HBM9793838.1 hypothetical protein [Escherichia albertii]
MFGFNAGLVMLGVMVVIPVIYLLSYGLNSFNKWRLGESMPQHKIKINIILALVIGFILGGVGQYFWDNVNSCMQTGRSQGECLLNIGKEAE